MRIDPATVVDLARHDLSEIRPDQLTSGATHLFLGWNRLTEIPAIDPSVTHLYLHDNAFTGPLPESLTDLARLRVLDLSHTRTVTALPATLGRLADLRFLYAAELDLTQLPDLSGLGRLEYLNVSDNRIATLPESVGELTSLQELRLQTNRLTVLPESLGRLTALRELHLDGNPLTAVPATIGHLTELRILSVRGCGLDRLPDGLDRLRHLHSLDLRANRLTTLPAGLERLPALERLDLRWSGWREPPAALAPLLERGCRIYC